MPTDSVVLCWPSDEPGVLERARSGDLAALEALFRTFERRIYGLALRVLRRPEDAEEVVQETFLEIARSLDTLREDASLWAWIRQIAVSKALMLIRRNAYRETDELPVDLGAPPRPDSERLDLESALGRLDAKARAVVWLHDVEGMTHTEIGEVMGRSQSFSKSQLSRAHARLRRLLHPPPQPLTQETRS